MRTHLQRVLVLSIGLISSITMFANSISGTVRDANGETIVGASVLVQNTTIGTVTDLDGQYQLDVDAGKKIVISYVGYKSQTISVTDSRTVYNVTLEEDSEVLDDVVVVGYGTQKRSDVTGAISSVSAKDIESFSTKSIAESLQGLAAGVSVTKGSGAPGEGADILIRGAGNLSGMSPLYVVDGVAQEAGFTFNMRDVESIEILKDAGSAAIYGSRAAGGVILITTKRGQQQKTHVNLNIRAGWRKTLTAHIVQLLCLCRCSIRTESLYTFKRLRRKIRPFTDICIGSGQISRLWRRIIILTERTFVIRTIEIRSVVIKPNTHWEPIKGIESKSMILCISRCHQLVHLL